MLIIGIKIKLLRASLVSHLVKNPPAMQETPVQFLGREDSWSGRRDRLPTPVCLGFPCGSAAKEAACNARDLGLIPLLKRSLGEGKGYPLQYSGLKATCSSILAWRIPWTIQSVESQRVGHDFHFMH